MGAMPFGRIAEAQEHRGQGPLLHGGCCRSAPWARCLSAGSRKSKSIAGKARSYTGLL